MGSNIIPEKIGVEDIRSEIIQDQIGFFRLRTVNQCLNDARQQPIPRPLYYPLWYEGELCILFADTGIGKSIKAVQIGNEISKSQKVLYLDLELSDKQFENRYSENYDNHYCFNEIFCRVDIPRFKVPDGITYENYFIDCLKELIRLTNARVIIIDNLTRILSSDTDRAQSAKPLMDTLNELKFEMNLSILALEHTRKTDAYRPISLNDLQGSKMKSNFCDSAFSIGHSQQDKRIRYIKQLKCRNAEITYDTENVLVCEVVKENSFLHFKKIGYSSEYDHLKKVTDETKNERIELAIELKQQGKSNVEIAKELGVSEGAIRKWLKKE